MTYINHSGIRVLLCCCRYRLLIIFNQGSKKQHQISISFQLISVGKLMCRQNPIQILIQLFFTFYMPDRISPRKSRMFCIFFCTVAGKSNPHIAPGVFLVCFIPSFHFRGNEKCIALFQLIFMFINFKYSFSASHNVQYIRSPKIRTILVSWIAVFPTTVNQTQIC